MIKLKFRNGPLILKSTIPRPPRGIILRLKASKRLKAKRKLKGSPKSISKLIKECDRAFSALVRRKNPDGAFYRTDGLNWCFTCGKCYPVQKLHCGHYLSRFYKAARWDYDNARPQCMMCNLWKKGDPIIFRQNLIKEIGIERVEAVEQKRHQSTKLSREFLTQLLTELNRV